MYERCTLRCEARAQNVLSKLQSAFKALQDAREALELQERDFIRKHGEHALRWEAHQQQTAAKHREKIKEFTVFCGSAEPMGLTAAPVQPSVELHQTLELRG